MASKRLSQMVTMLVVASASTTIDGFQALPSRAKGSAASHHHLLKIYDTIRNLGARTTSHSLASIRQSENDVRVNDLLSDVATPTLLIEMTLAESAIQTLTSSRPPSLNAFFHQNRSSFDLLDGSLFIHTRVTDTSIRDQINQELGSGKSLMIAEVDVEPKSIPGGAYLGIGLANHHVGGYYWARGMGIGASLAAHGIAFGAIASGRTTTESEGTKGELHHLKHDERLQVSEIGGESDVETSIAGALYWKKRGPGLNALETTEESSNSNDGKRSEWADFVVVGDTVQLVPYNVSRVLKESPFQQLIGIRRVGRPLGADPIVERVWDRPSVPRLHDGACWV